jgi:hypothetical protein
MHVSLGVFALLACAAATAADLTATETRWLRAGMPVLSYAKQRQLPVDIVVQPQDAPGQAPLAMDFVEGRCKLVLSMRGNPQAEASLDEAPAALQAIVIEAMTAHEVAHCWRHVHGRWKVLPAGFTEAARSTDPTASTAWRAMQATRREEGFADLAGLAWTSRRHPQHYAHVHAWFERVRDNPPVAGSHHDTSAWIRVARDAAAFPPGDDPFAQAQALWPMGMPSD